MGYDFLLLAAIIIIMFAAALIWTLYDDFKHDIKGLRKSHSRRRVRD